MRHPLTASIIIDNFNYADFVAQAIASALGQTYPHTEVIVVDDGSTDSSRDIIASFGQRVRPVFKENGGQASAFTAGFEASSGDLLCFLDSDDYLLPTAVEAAMARFDPQTVKIHWPLLEIDREGKPTGERVPARALAEGDLREQTIREGPLTYITPPTSGNAWSRRYLEAVMPVPECGNKHGADAYLSILAPLAGPMSAVPEFQGYYRVHEKSFSGNQRRVKRTPELFNIHCGILADALRREGIEPDVEAWRRKLFEWEDRVRAASEGLREHIPPGSGTILVDDGQLGAALMPGNQVWPFIERHGQYYGPPEDSQHATRELQRLTSLGAAYLVIAWPAFWWLEYYSPWAGFIRSRFRCVASGPDFIVYELASKEAP